jgi:hypothetical protein
VTIELIRIFNSNMSILWSLEFILQVHKISSVCAEYLRTHGTCREEVTLRLKKTGKGWDPEGSETS